jgi:hypothetical protein
MRDNLAKERIRDKSLRPKNLPNYLHEMGDLRGCQRNWTE